MEKSSENRIYRAIGLMSGTAMDGIDAALIETDGYHYANPLGFVSVEHDPKLREKLKSQLNKIEYEVEIEKDFTMAQIAVIGTLLKQVKMTADDIDVIGFHGQTIHHDPENHVTIQMGDGQLLADEIGVDVVYDFRSNDMKNGGQGAPLLPIYHRVLCQSHGVELPVAIINIGGVGNITWVSNDDMIAFDTGPGNAMIDDWVGLNTGNKYDANGSLAKIGTIHKDYIDGFLSNDYFQKPYPKSLDRNDFKDCSVHGLSVEDGVATLTSMTVQSIAKGVAQCPKPPNAIYVTGGGRHNNFIMDQIGLLTAIKTQSTDDLGWSGDSMEAEGFGYMAVRSILGEPISYSKTTGCKSPTIGGVKATSKRYAS